MVPSGSIRQEGKCYKSQPVLMCSLKTNGSNHTQQSQPISPAWVCSKDLPTYKTHERRSLGKRAGKRKVSYEMNVNNFAVDGLLQRHAMHMGVLLSSSGKAAWVNHSHSEIYQGRHISHCKVTHWLSEIASPSPQGDPSVPSGSLVIVVALPVALSMIQPHDVYKSESPLVVVLFHDPQTHEIWKYAQAKINFPTDLVLSYHHPLFQLHHPFPAEPSALIYSERSAKLHCNPPIEKQDEFQ